MVWDFCEGGVCDVRFVLTIIIWHLGTNNVTLVWSFVVIAKVRKYINFTYFVLSSKCWLYYFICYNLKKFCINFFHGDIPEFPPIFYTRFSQMQNVTWVMCDWCRRLTNNDKPNLRMIQMLTCALLCAMLLSKQFNFFAISGRKWSCSM